MTQKMIIVAKTPKMKHFNKKQLSNFDSIQQQPDFFDLELLLLPPPVAVCVSSTMTKRFRDILLDGLSPDALLSLRFANIPVDQQVRRRIRLGGIRLLGFRLSIDEIESKYPYDTARVRVDSGCSVVWVWIRVR